MSQGTNALINLNIDGAEQLSIIKEMQAHPVKDRVLHIDFQLIDRDEAIVVDVPIEFVGEPVELYRAGGLVQTQLTTLTVSAPGRTDPAVRGSRPQRARGGRRRPCGRHRAAATASPPTSIPEAVVVTGIVTRAAAAALEEGEEVEGEEGAEGEDGAEGAEASADGGDEDES